MPEGQGEPSSGDGNGSTGSGDDSGGGLVAGTIIFNPTITFAPQKGGQPGKGGRKTTGKPTGTPKPGKHAKPSPTNPGQWEVKDPHTGKWTLKPPGRTPTQGMIIETGAAAGAAVTAASIWIEILEGLAAAAVF